jgi:pSer/pThr/pTyr-binding forkhead associated (FHA) protein
MRVLPGKAHNMGDQFVPVPANAPPSAKAWKIILAPSDKPTSGRHIDLRGDAVIGSGPEGSADIDINVAEWGGEAAGVSHQHARLRPTPNNLYVLDLESTNGTHVNALPVAAIKAQPLADGDLITLGRLHIRVKLIAKPGE